jgi:hypothetical protein
MTPAPFPGAEFTGKGLTSLPRCRCGVEWLRFVMEAILGRAAEAGGPGHD